MTCRRPSAQRDEGRSDKAGEAVPLRVEEDLDGGKGGRSGDVQGKDGHPWVRLVRLLASLELRSIGSTLGLESLPSDASWWIDELNLEILATECQVGVVSVDCDSGIGVHTPVSSGGDTSQLVLEQNLLPAVDEADTTLDVGTEVGSGEVSRHECGRATWDIIDGRRALCLAGRTELNDWESVDVLIGTRNAESILPLSHLSVPQPTNTSLSFTAEVAITEIVCGS